jgi:hypothetical protein
MRVEHSLRIALLTNQEIAPSLLSSFVHEFFDWGQRYFINLLAGSISWFFGLALWFTSLNWVRRKYFEVRLLASGQLTQASAGKEVLVSNTRSLQFYTPCPSAIRSRLGEETLSRFAGRETETCKTLLKSRALSNIFYIEMQQDESTQSIRRMKPHLDCAQIARNLPLFLVYCTM